MAPSENTPFAITCATLDKLDEWVKRLSVPLPLVERVPTDRSFRWQFQDETPLVLLVAKVVRMASGIRAAMMLAEAGFGTECACLLRVVGDFGVEIVAVAEGEIRGQRTTAQKEFIEQFFSRPGVASVASMSPPKKDYVSREDLIKAHVRLAETAGEDREEYRTLIRLLSYGYDGYVHGAYRTAMELYHGERHEFMLRGHEGEKQRDLYRLAVSMKLVEVINACRLVAIVERDESLSGELGDAAKKLMEAPEQVEARGAQTSDADVS